MLGKNKTEQNKILLFQSYVVFQKVFDQRCAAEDDGR